ncbi:pyruvate kinase-like protein [Lachnotalea glycerini]|uniref:Pyruvate kinase n=1 Tax=Lachnotalea glycerini TaxID=1763509 RepID=A0A255IH01_9FIRM|nr:pyruvate kinase [Lachnotalea glycerini]PXV93367.1 pyruvate kinase-like protein [Lachnotalea glycerini]RDY28663.1 hypothetical protein CG710_019220 [Lachnotalea glycerini]
MKIIATLALARGIEPAESVLEICNSNSIYDFRINLDKLNDITDLNKAYEFIEYIRGFCNKNKIILDLPIPQKKLRINLYNSKMLDVKQHQIIKLSKKSVNLEECLGDINVDNFDSHFIENQFYYYADGLGKLRVQKIHTDYIEFECLNEFTLISRKSISSESQINLTFNREMYDFINKTNPDKIMFSFVEDIDFLKNVINKLNKNIDFLFKIETEKGVNNLSQICIEGNGIVVGRGDLGLTSDICLLPDFQNKIISISKNNNCPIYIATDILASMKDNNLPYRGDIFDLHNILVSDVTGIILNAPLLYGKNVNEALAIIKKMQDYYNK